MFSQVLQRYPFLRLLIMLGIGIAYGDVCPYTLPLNIFGTAAVLTIICLLICFYRNLHTLFSIVLLVACAALGFTLMGWKLGALDFPYSKDEAVYRITIEEYPEEKSRSILCRSTVDEIWADDSTMLRLERKKLFLLYFQKDSVSRRLKRGDVLWINAHLMPPHNNDNPDEFDYARFLRHRGVCGTGYVAAGHWQRISHRIERSFSQQALDQREQIVEHYRKLNFEEEELAVLSALTVGDKDDLSEDIIETYSVTGASHVLALSGMHIGFLYALFWFLFSPLWRRFQGLKPLLLLIIVSLLWGFAFLTGLSPSVVRSVVMFSILALSSLQTEKPLSANTLIITAFCMLLYNPCWLFDVGFQLSFTAVAAILIFYSKLYALCPVSNPIVKKLWGLMSVSVSAQIGTAPLVLLYFGRFSTHFLITNLWVIPLVSLVMYAGVLLLLLAPFPALQQSVAWITEKLIGLQNEGLRYIEHWPYASIDHWWIDVWMVALFYVAILLVYRWTQVRIFRNMSIALASVLLLLSYNAWYTWSNSHKPGLAFYNVRGCPAVHCLTGGSHSWLACADSLPDASWLFRSLDAHWSRLRLQPPRIITGGYTDEGIAFQNKILLFHGLRVCLLNDDRWRFQVAGVPMTIDYMYVSKGYKGGMAELLGLFNIRRVIIDGSLSPYYRDRVLTDCRELQIPYRLLEEGCVRVTL